MAKQKLDAQVRKNILKARKWIEDIAKKDANEAETRTRIHDICGMLMGYDRFEHITMEYEVPGAGETIHCDLAIQIDREETSKPDFLIEVKRVNMDLAPKHIGQAASYAINIGCEWVLLTNSRDWRLYHVSFSKPPQTTLVESWNLINDTPPTLAEKFALICYKNIKRSGLARLWDKTNVLTPQNLLKIILSEQSLKSIRRELKKANEEVLVPPEDIVGAIRNMLNETAVGEMEKVRISLPAKKQRRAASSKRSEEEEEEKQEQEAEINKENIEHA
jgi:hypothetical protein